MGSKKRKCTFNEELQKEYPCIKKTISDSDVRCNICAANFSISHGGRNDIKAHFNSGKHQKSASVVASTSSVTNFLKYEKMGSKEELLAAIEGTFAYHTVCHNHSFRSMDCTSKLLQTTLEPKFSCARTKAEAIITNIFAPNILNILHCNLKQCTFVSVLTDASNHKEIKLFPVLVRYFDWKSGIKVKILELNSLPNETSDTVSNYVADCIIKNNLKEKVVGLCADNTNSNFGGANRKGRNNVFIKLQQKLNHNLIGVGCAGHIFHNTVRTAADILPIDVELIVSKLYLYFKSYTVRVETLKHFCSFVETEFSMLLGYSQTRWLALLPAIERVLQMFAPLQSYFQSQEKCPVFLSKFFDNPFSEAWLHFVHSQAIGFHTAIIQIEKETVSVFDVIAAIENLKTILTSKIQDSFIPTAVCTKLDKLKEEKKVSEKQIIQFRADAVSFYQTALSYLQKWTKISFQDLDSYSWVTLNKTPVWVEIESSLLLVNKITTTHQISENDIYDEYAYMKLYVTEEKIAEWKNNRTVSIQRWVEMVSHFNNRELPFSNLRKLAEFFFCLPGTNASTERIFSLMNSFWTSDKTRLEIDTLKAILLTKVNYEENCTEFYTMLQSEKDLLKKIHSSEKYKKFCTQ